MALLKPAALTVKSSNGILRSIVTDIEVIVPGTNNNIKINAIWDTGATGSAISKKVAHNLGLIETGMAQVKTANGIANQKTYTVDIKLPNNVVIQGVTVTEVDELSGGCDALVGMDIITLGDFSITNHKGLSCFSFRVPSGHEIDYVKNLTYGITPIKNIAPGKIGSNIAVKKKKKK